MNEKPATFDETVNLYQGFIKNQIKRLKIDPRKFDEFYQVGMIGLWNAYRNYNPNKGTFTTCVFVHVRGSLLTALRDEHKYNKAHHFYDTTMCDFFQGKSDIVLQKEIIEGYCQRLSPTQQKVIISKFVHNKSFEEIATEEGVPLTKVRSWYRYALEKLRHQEKRR
ncbi:sigma-70 family RNA polymerase sigma factor [Priestia taiwanensis]|uniref:DNA-directed RNA polymerase sigma-70 factor n=1 Tax=Priestia taiwanensis TaxID=1347902 RepID=A0A917ERI1_9BACI|nr:sigma-70 family RNA polymerase sigma factor [Priestia taiwanensis]MBM7363970.1 DNA-directed RNA polymerase [Priestia taiwanensis]GGE70580.1 DNA-directed RNA polymerase sigma-70 factor [Priestia taiwanensis]